MSFYLDCLYEGHLMNLCLYPCLWHYDWHLYVFLDLSYLNPGLINDLRNFNFDNLDLFHNFQHLLDYLYLFWWSLDDLFDRYDLFNDLRYLDYPFLNLNDWNNLLNVLFYNFNPTLNVRDNLRDFLIFNHLDYFFD